MNLKDGLDSLEDIEGRMYAEMKFPNVHQVFYDQALEKPNYARSIFVGFTAPILNLPAAIMMTLVIPIFHGLVALMKMLFVLPYLSFSGKLVTHNITLQEAKFISTLKNVAIWSNGVSEK